MYIKYGLILLAVILISCSNNKEKSFTLKGRISNTPEYSYILVEELNPHSKILVDSSKLSSKGEFNLKVSAKNSNFYVIGFYNQEFVSQITILAKPEETIILSGDMNIIPAMYEIEGSEESKVIRDYNILFYKHLNEYDSLEYLKNNSPDSLLKKNITLNINEIRHKFNAKTKTFLDSNITSIGCIIIVSYFYKILSVEKDDDFEYFKKIDTTLFGLYPNSLQVINFHNGMKEVINKREISRLKDIELSKGNIAPELILKDKNKSEIKLSNYLGKDVIIYFWATWMNPCKEINKELNKYSLRKNKKYEIIAISLDKDNDDWLKEVQSLNYTNTNDLLSWESPGVKKYNIKSIPSFYFIDSNGKIVEQNNDIKYLRKLLKE